MYWSKQEIFRAIVLSVAIVMAVSIVLTGLVLLIRGEVT